MPTLFQSLISYLMLIGVLLGLLLLNNKLPKYHRWLSAYFFVAASVNLFRTFIRTSNFFDNYPFLLSFYDILNLTNVALLLIFVRFQVQKASSWTIVASSFIPTILYFLISTLAYSLAPWASANEFYKSIFFEWSAIPVGLALVFYYVLALVLLSKATKTAFLFTNIELLKIKWMQGFIFVLSVKAIFGMLFFMLQTTIKTSSVLADYQQYYLVFVNFLQLMLLFIILYLILRRANFFTEAEFNDLPSLERKLTNAFLSEKPNIEKNYLSEEQSNLIFNQLEDLMKTEKPFLQHQLNLTKLAELLQIQPHLLSRFMNERYEKNFNEYINTHRIEEAKQILNHEDTNDLTNYAVALNSGFSSESTFYAVFKKQTGITPNQYRSQKP